MTPDDIETLHARTVVLGAEENPLSVVFEMRGATIRAPRGELRLRTTGPAEALLDHCQLGVGSGRAWVLVL